MVSLGTGFDNRQAPPPAIRRAAASKQPSGLSDAHALEEEETNLSFLDFGSTKRHPRGTEHLEVAGNQNAPDLSGRGHSVFMEHETRFEFIGSTASATASPSAPTNHSLIARDSPSSWHALKRERL
jgi:hypothetical protein